MPELYDRPASELAALIATSTVSAREVLDAHIDRVEAVDPLINAVTWRMYEVAREQAERADRAVAQDATDLGPLHGVPVSIKDQFDVVDTPSTWGLPSRAGHRADREGPLVTRLRRAGAVPFVKTNVPVMLMQTETHNPVYGRTDNPYATDRTSGGSSGGEGALLAARGTPLGLGSDIGGSLRVPAHYCGIATIKPTGYRLPWGDSTAFDEWQEAIVPQPGPMARTVVDVTLGFRVLAEPTDDLPPEPRIPPLSVRDPATVRVAGLTVGVCEDDGGMRPSPAVRRAVREAADALAAAGARVVEWTPPRADEVFDLYAGLLGGDGFRHLRRDIGDDPISPVTRLLTGAGRLPRPVARGLGGLLQRMGQHGASAPIRNAGSRSFDAYSHLLLARQELLRRVARSLHDGPDVVLMPPHALPALRHGGFRDLTWSSTSTFFANLTGLPGGVVPVTTVRAGEETDRSPGMAVVERLARGHEKGSAGLPVGVQVLAPWWQEHLVLAAMATIEAGVDGVPPPVLPGPQVEGRS